MSEKNQKFLLLTLGVLTMSLIIGYFVFAWQEPTQPPPQENVPAPINVGSDLQYKVGALGVGGLGVDYDTHLAVLGGKVGIGTTEPDYKLDVSGDVRWTGTLQGGSVPWERLTSFPSACPSGQYVTGIGSDLTCSTPLGGGTVTSVSAGAGLTASPNPITDTGTISLNTAAISTCTNGTTNKIYWDSTNNRLVCGTDQTGGGGISGTISANQVAFGTGTNTIGGDNNLYWDNTNKRLGIGTTPSYKLDVNGVFRLRPTSAPPIGDNGVIYYDSSSNQFRCYQDGNWVSCLGGGGSLSCTTVPGERYCTCPKGYARTGCSFQACASGNYMSCFGVEPITNGCARTSGYTGGVVCYCCIIQ